MSVVVYDCQRPVNADALLLVFFQKNQRRNSVIIL